ncbi:MAG: heme transporter CcmC [Thaumarchaeota archaeon]|nr:MAG: heme transporter CcmC [Nitrososphaerota archaeon]
MKNFIVLTMVCLVALVLVPQIHFANAALIGKVSEKQYVNIRAEVWNLFFRMTTAAFVVGAIVSGTMIWLCWRFRESHPKNKTPTSWERLEDPTLGDSAEGH